MLYEPSGFRPHSSPDPFGATLSPGEGIFPVRFCWVTLSLYAPAEICYDTVKKEGTLCNI